MVFRGVVILGFLEDFVGAPDVEAEVGVPVQHLVFLTLDEREGLVVEAQDVLLYLAQVPQLWPLQYSAKNETRRTKLRKQRCE